MLPIILAAQLISGIGHLMNSSGVPEVPPPPVSFAILTEAGSPLTTEASSVLVTENAP